MSDEQSKVEPVSAGAGASPSDQAWGALVGVWRAWFGPLFAPVTSLFKARSWWVYVLFALLAWYMEDIRNELKASLLASVMTLGTCFFGYVIAKIVTPEVHVGEQLERVAEGNRAAAAVVVAAIVQRVVYAVLCFVGAMYFIPPVADKIR